MAFEVSCGQCQGRLMVEQAGVVVACPHCGAHLSIGEAPQPATEAPPQTAAQPEASAPSDAAHSPAATAALGTGAGPEAALAPASGEPGAVPQTEGTGQAADMPQPGVAGVPGTPAPEVAVSPDASAQPPGAIDPAPVTSPEDGVAVPPGATGETPAGPGNPTSGVPAPSTEAVAAPPPAPEVPGEPMPYIAEIPVPGTEAASPANIPGSTGEGQAPSPEGTPQSGPVVSEVVAPQQPPAAPVQEVAAAGAFSPSDAAQAATAAQAGAAEATATSAGIAAPAEQAPAAGAASPGDVTWTAGTPEPYARREKTVPQPQFSLLLSYAVAATIAVIILLYKVLNPGMSNLESLPDVKPPKRDGEITHKLVPEDAEMPPGHVLSLGESRRFGNLIVTPTKVTRGPVKFEHHLGDASINREPGPEVVKMWFQFENVSSDQEIAPLDKLVFHRDERDYENVRSNNFVCPRSEKKKGGDLIFVYNLNKDDIWNLKDQQVDYEIPPGEKIETYIPTTEEGPKKLTGVDEPLIWRTHFRKGYSPKNYGVTTVIEVAFDSSDIVRESSAKPAAGEKKKAA